jgi:hypothetical protein
MIRKKLQGVYFLLSKAKHKLDQSCRKMVYNSLFRSFMTYGLEHYMAASKTTLMPILKLQKKCIRIVYGMAYNDSTKETCKEKQILYLEDEGILLRIQMAKALTSDNAPMNTWQIYKRHTTHRDTRQNDSINLIVPRFRTTKLQKESTYQVPFLWNNLHQSAKELSMKSLSNHIRQQLLELYT